MMEFTSTAPSCAVDEGNPSPAQPATFTHECGSVHPLAPERKQAPHRVVVTDVLTGLRLARRYDTRRASGRRPPASQSFPHVAGPCPPPPPPPRPRRQRARAGHGRGAARAHEGALPLSRSRLPGALHEPVGGALFREAGPFGVRPDALGGVARLGGLRGGPAVQARPG